MKLLFENWKSYLHEGGLAGVQTEPRHEGNTPEERLINKLLIRSKIEKAGGDPQRPARPEPAAAPLARRGPPAAPPPHSPPRTLNARHSPRRTVMLVTDPHR